MITICSECKTYMGYTRSETNGIAHKLCPRCLERSQDRILERKRSPERPQD